MTASCAASCLFILMITAEFIYARQATGLSPATPVTIENGAVRIDTARLWPTAIFIVTRSTIRASMFASSPCRKPITASQPPSMPATSAGLRASYQKGSELVCRNCASNLVMATLGVEGGCNPIPIKSHLEGSKLVIDASVFDPGIKIFHAGM